MGESPDLLLQVHSFLSAGIMQGPYIYLVVITLSCNVYSAASAGCTSPATALCNFVCDCWDCSDERHCGYHKDSAVLGVPFSCDFEHDDCGWRDISTSSYRWARERLSSPMWGSRPHADHTLGNRWGWFMATGGHSGMSAVTATVRSPVLRNAAATCEIHVHYHVWSSGSTSNGSLSMQLTANAQTYTLWETGLKSALSWRRAVMYSGRISAEFQLSVTSSWESSAHGNVAIDDIEFRHCMLSGYIGCDLKIKQCDRGSCVDNKAWCDGTDDCGDNSDEKNCTNYHVCDFENDTCGWNVTNWNRVDGFSSRPSRDHTSNSRSGHVMGCDLGSSRSRQLRMLATNETCFLVLYYMMDGSNSSRLVIGYRLSNQATIVQAKVIQGPRDNVWLRESVHLPAISDTYQAIIIRANIASGTDAIIALDDLILSPDCNVNDSEDSQNETNSQAHVENDARINTKETCKEKVSERKDGGQDPQHFQTETGNRKHHTGRSTRNRKLLYHISSIMWADLDILIDIYPITAHLQYILRTKHRNAHGHRKKHSWCLLVTSSEGNLLTNAVIHSPTFCSTGPACAINMTYYFNSGPTGSLSVRVWDLEQDTHSHVWYSEEQDESWRSVVIPLGERTQPFQLVLSAFMDPLSGERWAASVDEIQFLQCKTIPSDTALTCNFEMGLCGWYQNPTDEINWELGELFDHTTGNGKCLHVTGESRMDRGTKARLISYPQSVDSSTQCLSFYYRIWGPDAGSLNLFIKFDGEEEQLLWTGKGTHGNRWHHESVTLANINKKYQLYLDAVRDGSVGQISVDDITLTSGYCAAPRRCSFEAGFCGFTTEGTYQWKIQQGTQARAHTGPFLDHTLQALTGHYAVVDTSTGALPKKKTATLTSGWHSAQPQQGCLSFWYQMSSGDAGTLNVDLVENTGKKQVKTRLLSVSETHSGDWHYKSVGLQSDQEWMIKLEAVGAGGDQCFIAVDDIHISRHHCHEPASCSFESGSCAWTNTHIPLMDTYDWDWTSGAALSTRDSIPEKDHTLGTTEGHYAFVDTGAMHIEGSTAWLISEHLPKTVGSCFTFWYRTDSSDHSHLGELVLFLISSHGLQPLWVLHGYHSSEWEQEQLQINSTVPFQIAFEGSKGTRPHSATLSLDDLTYTADVPCTAQKEDKGNRLQRSNNTGTTVAIVLGVLLLLACVTAAYYFYRKRKRNLAEAPQMSSQSSAIDGFDNVMFAENTIKSNPDTGCDISPVCRRGE
ncbi:apical endosomal glyco [Pelobates cultripes]|uniref:Apical endosomal glyco n=1 Tax=Pelobates cultripes TaxID=61616 RepID=A0AAD1WPJ2_PELCU|nr:apical endosomal glyco [Pelobates cultripes]